MSSSFWNNHFRPAKAKAGVQCRVHDLRHTSVALAIAAGAHPKAIQSRMGHSSINVTLDRYGHLFPTLDENIATTFDAELSGSYAVESACYQLTRALGPLLVAVAARRGGRGYNRGTSSRLLQVVPPRA